LNTSVDEFANLNVNVFPNPSNGIVNITGIFNYGNSYAVNVYDIYGKEVLKLTNESRIDLSAFNNGTYIVHIISEKGETIVKKVSLIK
ncbi:MAG: T9SS type A sorting domain-containing protein, partial [Vicingaceae bacterium]|nr:T9SS type A sorting domain-containing protein [Vicingaceae bacterium]